MTTTDVLQTMAILLLCIGCGFLSRSVQHLAKAQESLAEAIRKSLRSRP